MILTHSDADHTGVAAKLREAGARVLIHADDDDTCASRAPRPAMRAQDFFTQLHSRRFWRFFYGMARGGPREAHGDPGPRALRRRRRARRAGNPL